MSAYHSRAGFWIVSLLVASINPEDLDAIDENLPFTKHTLDDLLGRTHTPQEYQFYFERNPHAPIYVDLYPRFLNEHSVGRAIVSVHEQKHRESRGHYTDGKPPAHGQTGGGVFAFFKQHGTHDLGPQLQPHTDAAAAAGRASGHY
jgi:hypothetical protein